MGNIQDYYDGGKFVKLITQKTKSIDTIPISKEALELFGNTGDGIIFKGLKRSMTQVPMKKWIKSAGITKNITFHSYRRTFATLQATAGTDIVTIASIMTHKSISTPQPYTKTVDTNKCKASSKITLKRQEE